MSDDDTRTGRRRVDLTVGIHLDGNDVEVDTGAIILALEELLEGATVYAGAARSPFVVDHVDDPIHVHSARSGPR